jgi:hypothetical protein
MGLRRHIKFDTVREIGERFPGTEVGTTYGSPALKVNGRTYAGVPVHREAEPHSLGVYVADLEQRDLLLAEDPDTYYIKPHHEPYPIVLVRLGRITRAALEDLLRGAHRVVAAKSAQSRVGRRANARQQPRVGDPTRKRTAR